MLSGYQLFILVAIQTLYEDDRPMPRILDKSRSNRRLNCLSNFLFQLFFQVGHHLKTIAGAGDYVIDSFPVAVCDKVLISG